MDIAISLDDRPDREEVLALYRANAWSSAHKPQQLMAALENSHALVTARVDGRLVGLGNAISDGNLVVYYPHLLLHPEYREHGVGRRLMHALQAQYSIFHQQMLTADGRAVEFYRAMGFEAAGKTQAMWIYGGSEH